MAASRRDGRFVLSTSGPDGWNPLFVVPLAVGNPVQLTRGDFEVSFPSWSKDGRTIFFASTEGGTEQRHLYSVPVSGGPRNRLTQEPAVNTTTALSPQGDRLPFILSDPSPLPHPCVM